MSSRERRRKIQGEENLLSANPNTLDPKTADAIGFGLGDLALEIAAADNEYQAIEAVSIQEIHPNTIQPRYSIPHDLTDIFALHPRNIVDIFERWIIEVQLETGRKDFDVLPFLHGAVTHRGEQAESDNTDSSAADHPPSSKEQGLMKIVDLAASIRRDGLSNPISLVRHTDHFEIETGERRWLAYHLLYWKFGDGDQRADGSLVNWSRIPSRVVNQVDVWRQASENNARDNLNAIGRARQLALLLMDLHGWNNFAKIDACENEQAFYAQVADGALWRIPRGQGERMLNAMGLSDAGQLRQYRALLRLPADLWRKGDDEDLTEGELRKMKAALDSVTRVTVSPPKRKKDAVARLAADATHWRNKLRKEINSLDPTNKPKIRRLIEAEIRQLMRLIADLDESHS
ncbi:MAG: ParB N-terminal domain-containing protein [Chloroflexi bacterium]|nr:ParB N-terminal domain-containing protein [Chloroflexota bacterium]